ncbi:MAG TPA: AAA family ATPase, partial [Gammaproteobacteria bacterium]|nr:AAA family ATPase [Gammaproteobacteria bacterium]
GAQREQMVGRPCYEVSHHNDRPCFELGEECPHQRVMAKGECSSCLHVHYDDEGHVHRVRIKAYPLHDHSGQLYLGEAIQELSEPDEQHHDRLRMVGTSAAFLETLEQLNLAAVSDAPVLLEGETGTGKDLAANFIHLHSSRQNKPFLTLDCTVLTESLFESEVFGHERGAFTGSVGVKEGLFELVDGGTLFLDEIGEIPATLQAKLLRVLETGEYRRVGGRRIRHTNARIICATNRNLTADTGTGSFREDLYYRIACLHLRMPALRERARDIPLLAEALLDRISESSGKTYRLEPQAIGKLESYSYPGNIRELRNILSAAAARSTTREISTAAITAVINSIQCRQQADGIATPPAVTRLRAHTTRQTGPTLNDLEVEHISRLLQQHDGNRRKVASALGIGERTLYRKLKRYHLN